MEFPKSFFHRLGPGGEAVSAASMVDPAFWKSPQPRLGDPCRFGKDLIALIDQGRLFSPPPITLKAQRFRYQVQFGFSTRLGT
jgi:hypothetical protein